MSGSRISTLGSALADPTRAAALAALLSGTAHTSGELARACGVAASTMSSHLGKLVDSGLVRVEAAGRYRHYRIASREVADLLERIDEVDLPETATPRRPSPGRDLSYARSCYDHVAGQLGVEIHDTFVDRGWVELDESDPNHHGVSLTDAGDRFLSQALGIDVAALATRSRRPMLRIDIDWTERRNHLAGAVAAELMTLMLEEKWLRRRTDKRVLTVSETGKAKLAEHFDIRV